ncbi:diaminopimelate epimerase [Bacteroidales bacterium OttesenSCG-928-B11]|nr:diaminopimelate epimerase [Bacteroidales bacterium OttesenSCG-928-C03]MDL2311576.1 diaminopimelate epimerase [Bacteroidales bacterium OttesenSCG-928-B11]MDL2326792.1 diaminopimelate epimerase [Bacteroidales bacterium OttesenSCG-928-A14]
MQSNSFYKFHGTGNDFIIIDNRQGLSFSKAQIEAWCRRRTGIGSDGFILLEESSDADFRMRYFNADGGEASLCGNGSRCAVAFAHFLGIIEKQALFSAFDGLHKAEVIEHADYEWLISLEMNSNLRIATFEDGYFTDTGSPHFIRFVDDLENIDLLNEGRKIRHDSRFPEGCNANFVKINPDHIEVRTFERGVEDETLSCGTGVTASAIVLSIQNNFSDGNHVIPIRTKGGNLQVKYTKKGSTFSNLYLQGPAVMAFLGKV